MRILSNQQDFVSSQGWALIADNEHSRLYESDGYRLCLFQYAGQSTGDGIRARVFPFAKGAASSQIPIAGQGARARATAAARDLWAAHAKYLSDVGIELEEVHVLQHIGRGCGSEIRSKAYIKSDLF